MPKTPSDFHLDTQLVHLGNEPAQQFGYVSPPVYRGSTALYGNMKTMKDSHQDPHTKTLPAYGRFGTPNSRALEKALSELEGGHDTVLTNSGLSAITTALLALTQAGDHILVVDSAYWPGRRFSSSLQRYGIEVDFFDPRLGAKIETLFRTNTRIVYLESPGSLTFEIQDIPAIAEVCRRRGVRTILDNTWATPLFFQPLSHGVDVSIHSGTKYLAGHADSFFGALICNEACYAPIRAEALNLGQCAGPEDVFLGLRGLRTLSVRLKQHEHQALEMAQWLETRPEVDELLHPALPNNQDHQLWKRDFKGSSGLFGFYLKESIAPESVDDFLNALQLFGLGHSWGGYESLVMSSHPSSWREHYHTKKDRSLIRLHIGFENCSDLKADLSQAFTHLKNRE